MLPPQNPNTADGQNFLYHKENPQDSAVQLQNYGLVYDNCSPQDYKYGGPANSSAPTAYIERSFKESKLPSTVGPPFEKTVILRSLYDEGGTVITPSIRAKIDKGFFKAGSDWTCYRRNYFSVICEYCLDPDIKQLGLFLSWSDTSKTERVEALGVCISGKVAGDNGKTVDLVLHTPNRDKGPQLRPSSIVKLSPHSSGTPPISLSTRLAEHRHGYRNTQPNQADQITTGAEEGVSERVLDFYSDPGQHIANFERIQFKCATANNGKRRAAQQYFLIAVDLFGMIRSGQSSETQWVKIATCPSVPLVVRGRSPGHYADDRRSSQYSLGNDQYASPKQLSNNAAVNNADPPTQSTPILDYRYYPSSPVLRDSEQRFISGQPTVADPTPLPEDDNSSISSISNLFSRANFSSASSIADRVEVVDQLVSLMLDDKGLEALCVDGFTRLHADRFERNLRRLLRIYALELCREASTEIETMAARFVKARVRYMVSSIRRAVDPGSVRKAEEMKSLLDQKVEKELSVEHYLQTNQAIDIPKIASDFADSDISSLQEQDDRDGDFIGRSESADLLQIEKLIINENAFEELRESLMGFVVPLLLDVQKSASTSDLFNQQAVVDSWKSNLREGMLEDVKLLQDLCRSIVGLSDALKDSLDRSSAACLHRYLCSIYGDLQNIIVEDMGKGDHNCTSKWIGPNAWGLCFLRIRAALEKVENRLESKSTISLQERYQYQENQKTRENKKQVRLSLNLLPRKSSQTWHEPSSGVYSKLAQTNQTGPFTQTQHDIKYHPDLRTELGAETSHFIRILDNMRDLQVSNPQHSIPKANEKDFNDSVINDLECKEKSDKSSSWLGADRILPNKGFIPENWAISYRTLFIWTWQKITHELRSISRPSIQSGHRRIEWVCDCGETLWGDFRDRNPEALAALTASLQCSLSDASSSPTHPINNHQPSSAARQSVSGPKNPVKHYSPASNSNCSQPIVCTGSIPSVLGTEKYLELCLNTGEYDVSLAEIAISRNQQSIDNDGQLFQEIRKRYQKTRGIIKTPNFHLFKPVDVHFVEFCFEDGDVGILKSPLSFPLEKDIQSKEWEFCSCPCPLKDPPPMPANVFLHHLNSKRTHPRRTWLDRLPKKLNHSIHQNPDPSSTHIGWQAHGWGVQIIEGPNGKAMLWLTVVNVLTSLAAALSWGFVKSDVQGACGIGGFMLAASSAMVFAFYTYYQVHHF
ncbi:hypothetical protein MMC22_004289 [Lobaria immixta]|nr:hypothetical protein [Lobaria immixta]